MTKNASDLLKALVQHPLKKTAKPLEREGTLEQDVFVNAPNAKTKEAARPGKKAMHALLQPHQNELERDPSDAEPLEKTDSSTWAKGGTASAKPATDSGSESLGTWHLDAFQLTQGEQELFAESGLPPGHYGNSVLLAQAGTATTSPSTETKATSEALHATTTSAPPAPWAWFIPAALVGVGMAKTSSETSDTVTRLRVVDGPIEGAKVYLDLDNDGVVDEGEPEVGFTDSTGFANVTLTAEQAKYALLAKGGTDTETNKAFAGVHAAPAGSTVINPLTTLVAAMMESGQSLADAKAAVVTALGLTGVSDLTSYDTFAQASTPEGMANHLKAVQIANIIVAGSALAAIDGSAAAQTGAASRVIDALAAKISGTLGAVTFNAQVLEEVLTTAGASSHAASVAAAIEAVNTVVANASGPDALAKVAQAQVLAQVTLTNAIKTADTGGLAIVTALQDSTTAAQLADQIDAKSSDVTAPTLTITSSATVVKSGESAIITFSFSEAPTGFEASDVTTTGGTLSTPTVSSTDPKVYTAIFTPTLASGSASITVGSASYTDAAGNSAGSTPAILIEKPVVPVEIVFAQRVIMDGATVGGDPSIANLQTTAIKYSLTTNVSIQGLDVDDFLVTNGEVTRVYQPASFEFSKDQKLQEILGNGLIIIRDISLMDGAFYLVTPNGQASQTYDNIQALGELADGTMVVIAKKYPGDTTGSYGFVELKFYDATGEEIPDYQTDQYPTIDFSKLSNAEIINSSAIVFKFSDSNDLLVDSKGSTRDFPQSSNFEYWTLPEDGGTLIYHSSYSEARFASNAPQSNDVNPGIGVVFLAANGEMTATHPYGDHDFDGAVIKDVVRGAIIYSTYDTTTSSSSIHLIDQEGTKISNSAAGWDYYYDLYGKNNNLIQINRSWNYSLDLEYPSQDTYSTIVFFGADGRLMQAGGTGSQAYYGGHDFEGANIGTIYDNGVITYYLYDPSMGDYSSGYIINKKGDSVFIEDIYLLWNGSTNQYSDGSVIFQLRDGPKILFNAVGEKTKLSEYLDGSYSLLDAKGDELVILGATEFSKITHKSSSNGVNYWEVEITGSDQVVTKAIAVINELGILTEVNALPASSYYTPGLQIGTFELGENQYIYSWLDNGTFIVGDYALYDPALNPKLFLNNNGERVNTFVLVDGAGHVLSEYFTNENITKSKDNYSDSSSYISGIPEGGMVLKLQINEPEDSEGDELTTAWQILVLDKENNVSMEVYISPDERIYYLKSILPEGLIFSAFNAENNIIYKLVNLEGETLASFDNYLIAADGQLFLDMDDEAQTWDWDLGQASTLTFTPDPLKWMVEVKPLYGVEGEIELSLITDATIADKDGAPLTLGALPATPLVTVDTKGPTPSKLSINSRTEGSISMNGETDFYSIELTEGEKYIFTLEASSSSKLDAGLTLFGPSASSNTISLLTNDNAFHLNNNARIIYTAQETGTYYLLANGGTKSSGDYLLSVSDKNVPTPSRIAIPNPPTDAASPNPDIQWKYIPSRGTGEEFYLIVDAPKNSPLWTAEDLPYWTDSANRSLLVDIASGQEFKHNGDQEGIRSGNIFVWDGPTIQSHVMQDLSRNTDYVYVVPKDAITGVNGFTNDYYESTIYHTTNDATGPKAISGGVIFNVFSSDTFFPIEPSWANLKLDVTSSNTYSQPFILDDVPDLLWIQFDEKIRSSTGGWNQGWAAKHNDVFDGVYLKENGVAILEFDVNFDDIQHDPNQWGAPFRYPTGLLNVKTIDSEVVGGLPWVDYSGLENGMWLNLHQAVSSWGGQYVSDDYVNNYEFKAGATYTLVVDAPIEDIYFNVSDDSTPLFEFSFMIKPIQDPLAV